MKVSQIAVTRMDHLGSDDIEFLTRMFEVAPNMFVIVDNVDLPTRVGRFMLETFRIWPTEMRVSKQHPQLELFLDLAYYEVEFRDSYILRFEA